MLTFKVGEGFGADSEDVVHELDFEGLGDEEDGQDTVDKEFVDGSWELPGYCWLWG